MTVHYLQHVPFEGLGAIEDWCGAARARDHRHATLLGAVAAPLRR